MKKHLLDLRDRGMKPIKVVERIIFKPRSPKVEAIKMFSVIVIVTAIGFGISRADENNLNPFIQEEPQPSETNITGIYGKVVATSTETIILDDSQGSKYEGIDIFYVDLTNLKTIKTNEDNPTTLTLSDINVGDTIIARGIIDGTKINVQDIISFSATSSKILTPELTSTTTEETATSTATTTNEEIVTSTTTEATTTSSIIENVSNTVGNIVDKVSDVVNNVIDTFTGSSNATSTEITTPAPQETPAPEVTPSTEVVPVPDAPPSDTTPTE